MANLELYGANDEVSLGHQNFQFSLTDQVRVDASARVGGRGHTCTCR